ncbi:unnamed protein product [Cylicostephanus goldi]|uniref:P-type domain-containing protein n=1 Tax=Cylicostephanus goldi TaxID=71465 RepID=A0A3P7QN38_CYLGO|nr:unnamed protein product [Cylicostephanus goldi]
MWLVPYIFLLGITTGEDVRFDCHPEPDASKEVCERRNCIWKEDTITEGIPYCFMKPKIGYKLLRRIGDARTLTKSSGPMNPWGEDIKEIYFASHYFGKTLNVKIFVGGRYEPPLDLPREPSKSIEDLELTTYDEENPFYFTVSRESTQTKLWDTSLGK